MEGGTNIAPLPNDLPPAPDLSRVPLSVLHTGTVETLIGHGEDLTARLMVHIRRNANLEGQLLERDRSNKELALTNSSLLSQLEILQEKDRIWKDKSSHIDDRQEALRGTVDDLNSLVGQLENQNGKLRAALALSLSFQRRVRLWVRPLLNKLTAELKNERAARGATDAKLSDQRARLAEMASELRSMESSTRRDQTKLVEQYESRLVQYQQLKDKAQRFDDAVKTKAEMENKLILIERKRLDTEAALERDLKNVRSQMNEYRQEAKDSAAESMALRSRLEEKIASCTDLEERHERLQDQFESVQSVWADAQKRLESAKLQHETLNRLNQELSLKLREQRRDEKPSSPNL